MDQTADAKAATVAKPAVHSGQRLAKYPARNRHSAVKSPLGTMYEITPDLTGAVLFDFVAAADVIDVLQSVEVYLSQ